MSLEQPIRSGRRGRRLFRILSRLTAAAGFLGVLTLSYLGVVIATLPDVAHLDTTNPVQTAYLLNWAEARDFQPEPFQRGSWARVEEIPVLLRDAVVVAEDERFYEHGGVEWRRTRKMALRFFTGREAVGASTITQQLARNLFLHQGLSFHRKIREVLLAKKLERQLSKDRILELYLNLIEWGEGVWGITHASRHYFNREVDSLDPFACIFLPGLLPAPRQELTGSNLRRAMGVYDRVCRHLRRIGQITDHDWAYAKRRLALLEIEMVLGSTLSRALAEIRTIPGGTDVTSTPPAE